MENLDTMITKRDVIATVMFVAGAYLFYKGVSGLIKDHRESKRNQKAQEQWRKKCEERRAK